MIEELVSEKLYTAEEYFAFEEKASIKHEFYNGKIIPVPGGSFIHNTIATNIATALKIALKTSKKKYFVSNSDTKIQIEALNHFVYPDTVVVSEKPVYYKNRKDIIINPLLVVEVLSDSTERYDRGLKFEEYCTLPSFQQYVLVAQHQPYISTFYREQEDLWRRTNVQGFQHTIYLPSLEVELLLADVYDGVDEIRAI